MGQHITDADTNHDKLTLRPTRLVDLDFVMDAEQNPDNASYVNQWKRAEHEAAIVSENDGHFIVEIEGKPIGYVILSGLQDPHKTILLRRIVIMPKREGYGRRALQWVKTFTFEELGYHRLWLDVLVSNEPAQRLYASEGFTAEGRMREAYRTEEGYEDMFILSLLEDDYCDRDDAPTLENETVERKTEEDEIGLASDSKE